MNFEDRMMQKNGFMLFLILTIFLTQCGDKRVKEFLESYSKIIVEFPNELIDHFPHEFKSIGQLSAVTPAGAHGHDMALLFLAVDTDSLEILSLKQRLKKANATEFTPNDSSLIIVGDTVDYSRKAGGTPIPSFIRYEKDFGLHSVRLDKDFMIYVLESKNGQYMDKENLTMGNKFPPDWKNGFSRGLAINEQEKKVIYWLTIW